MGETTQEERDHVRTTLIREGERLDSFNIRLLNDADRLEQAEARADRERKKYWTAAEGKIQAERERDEARTLLRDCDKVRQQTDGIELQDAIDNDGVPYQSETLDAHLRGSDTQEGE